MPRSYLQRFANNAERTTICIGNISTQRVILGASIRDQCYKNYYYGTDGKLEVAISSLEGHAIDLFRNIDRFDNYLPNRAEREILWLYVATLRGRTEAGELLIASFHEGSADLMAKLYGAAAAKKALEETRPRTDVIDSLRAHTLSSASLYDLRVVFLRAAPETHFLTSDAPVIQTNMFRPSSRPDHSSGMITAGLVVIMPISPSHCLLAFAPGVYSYRDTNPGRVTLTKRADVIAINRAISASSLRNIYFSDPSRIGFSVNRRLAELAREDREGKVVLQVYAEVEAGKYVRTTADAEEGKKGSYLISHHFTRPTGVLVLGDFNVRMKPSFADTRSAAGLVRDRAWAQIVQEYSDLGRKPGLVPSARDFALAHPLFERVGGWKAWLA